MNPVEIGDAIIDLAQQPFDAGEFPFQFLEAFGNKKTAIDRLRKGNTNQSDILGAVLQRSHIHIATCQPGTVGDTLTALRGSPKTASQKAHFILATDGDRFEAEDVATGETVVCDYSDFANHFGFFLPLAGISTVAQIRESSFDIRATGRLNKLYVTLLQDNPEWVAADRRSDMNHFMARLIFCFFAEDTDIFHSGYKFTDTVERMSSGGADNTHEVIEELFRAMNTPIADRAAAGIKTWAGGFPYVNGQLFSGNIDVPRFSRTARGYLIHIGNLDWTKINPDIFGSMIQAVADDEERGALGMHYTSVPNILKVLNPLFLDDLRKHLEEAGDNARKLLNLRSRMARIRVFDPACGSGNFLVIAYKEMRAIEAEINKRRGEPDRRSEIPLTNFRGIELRDFPAEIARLALIIAEYQCDVLYRGQKEALAEFLPLDSQNWITCGNALRLDWLSICPPTGTGVKVRGHDLFETPLDQSEIDFENAGGETYICGNPPYLGSKWQDAKQKADLTVLLSGRSDGWKLLDYVAGWFVKAADYGMHTQCKAAGVTSVAMESTGVYWIPAYEVLEANGFHVILVNARYAKNVPGRKTDVSDAAWLQRLHSYGLLRGSFRPKAGVATLRAYLRQRERLIEYTASHIQHMQKALMEMNVQLHHVVSDITGVTGMRIIRAIVAGERSPRILAEMRDVRCHASVEKICAALSGNWRDEHIFALCQSLALYAFYQAKILECDRKLEVALKALEVGEGHDTRSLPKARTRTKQVNTPDFEVRSALYRVLGVDLTQIHGMGPSLALKLVGECGTDLAAWPSSKHFTSWLCLAPGNKISGGKLLSSKTRRSSSRAAALLRLAATTIGRTDTALGAFYRRLSARAGKAKAVTATARKIAVLFYNSLRYGMAYHDPGASQYEERYRSRVIGNLQLRAKAFGFCLQEMPEEPEMSVS